MLYQYFKRKLEKSRLRQSGIIQTFGYKLHAHKAGQDTIQFAQWLHPNESNKIFSRELMLKYREILPEGSSVIDIGAHTGDTSVLYAWATGPNGSVIAVEPNPYVYKILQVNSNLNNSVCGRIYPLNYAATVENKKYEFNYSDNGYCNGGNLAVIKNQNHKHNFTLEVDGRNMAELLPQKFDLENLSLIKTDTEGYDLYVLKSLENLILANRPKIICEVLRKFSFLERKELLDYIRSLDYIPFFLEENARSLKGEEVTEQNLMSRTAYDVLCISTKLTD